MPNFGRVEAYDEFGSSGPYAVWRARPAGTEGPGPLVVKTCLTQDMLADEQVVEKRAARFLAAAEFQRGLSGEGWAPISDVGRLPTHAYYVTEWYPSTLERVIEARSIAGLAEEDPISGAKAVVRLVSGITEGLERVQAGAGRGHGNLKATNVLLKLGDDGDLSGATVALADPAPPESIGSDSARDDARALAGLIHRLVTGRPAPGAGAVQVGPEWSRLGSPGPGEELRRVCEALLNVQAGTPPPTLAQVRDQLEACLRAKMVRKKSPVPLIASVVGVLLVGGGVAAYLLMGDDQPKRRPGADPREPSPQEWQASTQKVLQDAESTMLTVRPCMTDDQLARSDELGRRLAKSVEGLPVLAAAAWPQGEGETVLAERAALAKQIEEAEAEVGAIKAAAQGLKIEVGDCSEEVDPRRPDRQQWLSERESRLKAQIAAMTTELGAELAAAPDETLRGSVTSLTDQATAMIQKLDAVRAQEWPTVAAGGDSEAIKTARESRARIRSDVQSLATEVGQVTQAAEKMLRDSRDRVKSYLDARSRDRDKVSASDRLREAFAVAISAVKRTDPTWTEAKARADAIQAWIGAVDRELAVELQVALPPGSQVRLDPAGRYFSQARERAIEAAVRPVEDRGGIPNSEADLSLATKEKAALVALAEEIRTLLTQAGRIEQLLSRASGYDERTDGASVKALLEAIEASPRLGDIEAAVEVVVERARRLRTADSATGVAPAVAGLKDIGGDPARAAEAITYWRTLRKADYPADASQIVEAPALVNQQLLPALRGLGDKARGEALAGEVIEALRGAWFTFVHEKAGGDAAAVDAAFRASESYGLSEQDLDARLEPFAKFNRERWKLLASLDSVASVPDRNQQIARLQQLAAGLQGVAQSLGVAGRADVQDLFTNKRKLAPYLAGKFSNFEEVGPATPGVAARWKMEAQDEDNGLWAEYSLGGHRLRFQRVGESEEPASFVCTSEVSVGLFQTVMQTAGAWQDVRGKLTMLPKNDQRKGPRAWVWDDAGLAMGVSQPASGGDLNGRGWFRVLPGDINAANGPQVALYPQGREPAPPTAASPVNYVSTDGALFMAALMGCRVPTAEEWAQAARLGGGTANRRDTVWQGQHAHLRAQLEAAPERDRMSLQNNLPWPGADIFVPPDAATTPAAADGDPAISQSDSALWFQPVTEGTTTFENLEGNVAEIVLANEAAYARAPVPPKEGLLGAIKAAVKSADVRVVGASALSPGAVSPTTPYGVKSVSAYWSDVGFRLAFTASAGGGGGGRLTEKLRRILTTDTPYLTRAGG
ncbi:MAG: hypothetical protein DYG92_02395 [Leptolyngbya sp. PLA1]|nr:hypothetical protein [Leptolyngbya sp. PLA1]